jgi:hypothetical protein
MQHLAAALLIIFERIIVLLEVLVWMVRTLCWGDGHHHWPTGGRLDRQGLD